MLAIALQGTEQWKKMHNKTSIILFQSIFLNTAQWVVKNETWKLKIEESVNWVFLVLVEMSIKVNSLGNATRMINTYVLHCFKSAINIHNDNAVCH